MLNTDIVTDFQPSAISTPRLLLVPYDSRHVPRYHEWMSDPVRSLRFAMFSKTTFSLRRKANQEIFYQSILEATASEPLTLDEEFENQASWRASHDKLTFILCHPISTEDGRVRIAQAGQADTAEKMVGDINFFLYPWDDEEDTDGTRGKLDSCIGEVDIMIAGDSDRGKGLGKAAVSTFMHYIWSNLDAILEEYQSSSSAPTANGQDGAKLVLKLLMAKIKASNVHSIALFKGLGFEQEGDVNYFGEIKMVLKDFTRISGALDGYAELEYHRPAG